MGEPNVNGEDRSGNSRVENGLVQGVHYIELFLEKFYEVGMVAMRSGKSAIS